MMTSPNNRLSRITPTKKTAPDSTRTSKYSFNEERTYFQKLQQCSTHKGMNVYEYLDIPTFVRQGKIITGG